MERSRMRARLRRAPKGDEQLDFFIAQFVDIPIRDQRDMMERPFFSLAKTPRIKPIEYHSGDVYIRVDAHADCGMATIWDADILIWAATQITETRDRSQPTSPTLQFHPYYLLKTIRRGTSGRDYERLRAALKRLMRTTVHTSIRANGKEKIAEFHWLEDWGQEIEKDAKQPRWLRLTLPRWLYHGILDHNLVLSIHEDYFLLEGGLERWLYRVARKHAGKQESGWQFTMRQLYEKSGSLDQLKNFAIAIRRIARANHLPEYVMELECNEEGEEIISFIRRSLLAKDDPQYRAERRPRRRLGEGIHSESLKLPAV
jgi:plasmid replication initiation protein